MLTSLEASCRDRRSQRTGATRGYASPSPPHHTCAPLRPCQASLIPPHSMLPCPRIYQEGLFLTSCPSVQGLSSPGTKRRGGEGQPRLAQGRESLIRLGLPGMPGS